MNQSINTDSKNSKEPQQMNTDSKNSKEPPQPFWQDQSLYRFVSSEVKKACLSLQAI